MEESINKQVQIYQSCITDHSLSSTYKFLLTYMNQLQRDFKSEMAHVFTTKNVLNGYLDYTYFYFINEFLKGKGLKLGIIFNHQTIGFELWLMGSTKQTQTYYWNQFKDTQWNTEAIMPQWYIISMELNPNPNFDNLSEITDSIFKQIPIIYSELEDQLKRY